MLIQDIHAGKTVCRRMLSVTELKIEIDNFSAFVCFAATKLIKFDKKTAKKKTKAAPVIIAS